MIHFFDGDEPVESTEEEEDIPAAPAPMPEPMEPAVPETPVS